jgi:hypothetical protein
MVFDMGSTLDTTKWLPNLKDLINKTMNEMNMEIDKLGPGTLSVGRRGRTSVMKLLNDLPTRLKFSGVLVNFIKKNGVPDEVLSRLQIPKAGDVI